MRGRHGKQEESVEAEIEAGVRRGHAGGLVRHVLQQIAGLALQHFADAGQRIEADALDLARLQQGKVGFVMPISCASWRAFILRCASFTSSLTTIAIR